MNKALNEALTFMNQVNAQKDKWAALEASAIEDYCRVKVGRVHSNGFYETEQDIYSFTEYDGEVMISKYTKN